MSGTLRIGRSSTPTVGRLTRDLLAGVLLYVLPSTVLPSVRFKISPERNGGRSMGMVKMLFATVLMVSVFLGTDAIGQTQNPPPARQTPPPASTPPPMAGEEKTVEGQVRSIDSSGTEIILTDDIRLVTPPGRALRPGALAEGANVIASYRELNGQKVLTDIALKEPSASPRTGPSSPGGPSPAPPSDSSKRY